MAAPDTHSKDLLQFIQEHRSNAINFGKLTERLDAELRSAAPDTTYHTALTETKEKYATAYKAALEQGGPAWPEYESFVAHFERSVVAAQKEA
jgi:hypothetical protein